MGRLTRLPLALALLLAAALTLAACGGEDADLLPGKTASEIKSNLAQVETLVADGDCIGAADAAAAVAEQVESLGGVDSKLKQALSKGATRLNEVVAGCEEAEEEEAVETTPAIEPEEEVESSATEKPRRDREREGRGKGRGNSEAGSEGSEGKPDRGSGAETTEPPEVGEGEAENPPPAAEEGGGTPSGGVSAGTPAE